MIIFMQIKRTYHYLHSSWMTLQALLFEDRFFLGFLEANKHQQTSGHILLGVTRVPLLDASDHAFPDIHDLFGLSKQMYVQ